MRLPKIKTETIEYKLSKGQEKQAELIKAARGKVTIIIKKDTNVARVLDPNEWWILER